MQNPPVNPSDMILVQQLENNSGSTFFAVAVIIVFIGFIMYTVVLPKFKRSDNLKDTKDQGNEGGE